MKPNGIILRVFSIVFCVGLTCVVLSSCSLFESKIRIPVAKKIDVPPEPPPCDAPYCAVDLDYPLSLVTKPKIYVSKSERKLRLVNDKTLVREYHIGLGPSPRGDKYFKGDGRTPEGEYSVCVKKNPSQYYKSFGINYPAPRHAEAALSSGTITYDDYCQIIQANDSGRMPPANTPLGGLIFIHGGGCHTDWTLGCVAVRNSAMDELFEIIQVGTPVIIEK